MTISGTNKTSFVIKVNNNGGIITSNTPITLKNQIQDRPIKSIEDIDDVSEVSVTDGATLIYNANNDLYEIKQLDIDGGTY